MLRDNRAARSKLTLVSINQQHVHRRSVVVGRSWFNRGGLKVPLLDS